MKKKEILYIALVSILAISLLIGFCVETFGLNLGGLSWIGTWVSSPVTLLLGLAFALIIGKAFPTFTKTMSKKLLQYSVVGLGFGMTLQSAVASGADGMMITLVSVFGTLGLGWLIGQKLLKVDWQTSYLISSGTAICGGSAIAATGSVIKAKAESMSVALGVVFVLNAIALFIFPPIGHWLDMSQHAFGTWAAIAIHDTSSVVGAGSVYGEEALQVATTVKLTRALWIAVLAVATPFFFSNRLKNQEGAQKKWYQVIPNFIIWFIIAIVLNTFLFSQFELGQTITHAISKFAKHMITLSLFFIGAGLTWDTLKAVGIRPLIQGILLWIIISCASLSYVLWLA